MNKTIVLAIGGNSLITDPKHVTVASQYEAVRQTAEHIVELVKQGHKLVITHGNGPQVGFILRRAELARKELHPVPLDSCVADTQGALGYNIQMAMHNELLIHGLQRNIVTLVTQVIVDRDDPSFENPSKPIGSFLSEEDAARRRDRDGWTVVEDAGRGYRRTVPSPNPIEIVERDAVSALLEKGFIVVVAGGGGIPVVKTDSGELKGVEAVIDKDSVAALLACDLTADRLIISTSVEKVSLNYGKPDQKELERITVAEAEEYMDAGHFATGSMLPKMEAMLTFVRHTVSEGIITDPAHLLRAINGSAGTTIVP